MSGREVNVSRPIGAFGSLMKPEDFARALDDLEALGLVRVVGCDPDAGATVEVLARTMAGAGAGDAPRVTIELVDGATGHFGPPVIAGAVDYTNRFDGVTSSRDAIAKAVEYIRKAPHLPLRPAPPVPVPPGYAEKERVIVENAADPKQTEKILRAVKEGADTGAAVARALALHPYRATKAIDALITDELLEVRGAGRGRRLYVRGHAPAEGAAPSRSATTTDRRGGRPRDGASRFDKIRTSLEREIAELEEEVEELTQREVAIDERRAAARVELEALRRAEKALAESPGARS